MSNFDGTKVSKENLSLVWKKVAELVKLITGDVDVGNDGNLQSQIKKFIDDEKSSDASTWSSQKIEDLISKIGYKRVDVTVEAANWEGSDAPFTNTITVSGATETNDIQVMPADTITVEQVEAWAGAMVIAATQVNGSITLKAFGDKPGIDIPITVLVGSDVVGGE